MSATTSTNGSKSPANQATMTPERGEPDTHTTHSLKPGIEIGHPARLNLPLAKLTLKLRNTPIEPTPEPYTARRSGRIVKAPAKHGKDATGNGAPLPKTNSRDKKSLQRNSTESSGVGTARPLHAFEKRTTGYIDGALPSNSGGSVATEKRGGSSLHVEPGNINDPIDVDALPSPPPHQWINRPANYYAPFPLQYRPSRPNIPPTLFTQYGVANQPGRVSGHRSHDIYRSYIDLEDAPAPLGFAISCAKLSAEVSAGRSHSGGSTPFPHVYSAHVNGAGRGHGGIVNQPYASSLQRQYQSYPHDYRTHTNSYHTPLHGHPIFPVLNEEHLRQRAVRFVLDHSRPRTRKRRLSDDPDETSGSEYDDAHEQPQKKGKISLPTERASTPSQPSDETMVGTPSTGRSEDEIFDRNLKLAEMVEHTQLLTGMLMTYPRSADHKGMREDIAMLATVTDERLASWECAERKFDQDTRQRLTSAATPSPNMPGASTTTFDGRKKAAGQVATEGKMKKRPEEDEVQKYLFADAKVWGNIGRETAM